MKITKPGFVPEFDYTNNWWLGLELKCLHCHAIGILEQSDELDVTFEECDGQSVLISVPCNTPNCKYHNMIGIFNGDEVGAFIL